MLSSQRLPKKIKLERAKQVLEASQDAKSLADANYILFVFYRNGWVVDMDEQLAMDYLRAAEQLGHSGAKIELSRIQGRLVRAQQQASRDMQVTKQAESNFQEKVGLEELVQSEIMPNMVRIVVGNSHEGTGFFQHGEWIISNAHVLSSKVEIRESKFIGFTNEELPIFTEQAYIRDKDNENCPDVAILKTRSSNAPGLSLMFQDNFDLGVLDSSVYFCVHFSQKTGKFEIAYLSRTASDTSPECFIFTGGVRPEEGASGAPIFEAKIHKTRKILWTYKVASILYARCDLDWYKRNNPMMAVEIDGENKIFFAFKVSPELEDIRQIIANKENMERARQAADICASEDNEGIRHFEDNYREVEKLNRKLAEYKIQKYQEGQGFDIPIPTGMEKLTYRICLLRGVSESQERDKKSRFEANLNALRAIYNKEAEHSAHKQWRDWILRCKKMFLQKLRDMDCNYQHKITIRKNPDELWAFADKHLPNDGERRKDQSSRVAKTRPFGKGDGELISSILFSAHDRNGEPVDINIALNYELQRVIANLDVDDIWYIAPVCGTPLEGFEPTHENFQIKRRKLYVSHHVFKIDSKYLNPEDRRVITKRTTHDFIVFGITLKDGVPVINHLEGCFSSCKKKDIGLTDIEIKEHEDLHKRLQFLQASCLTSNKSRVGYSTEDTTSRRERRPRS